ncbi:tryptophan 7-halogenase [Alteromonas sp. ASW11-19]|uniref:Tryptophan 7-halogenase n=1 Tax=Alteromonas salexigens TaxID=2982530 RepID=A0ABT2VMX9_9ALTE|nr:tryptophan halogenase family protein [Alteromonas salexigens]MCU7554243.1 tryptophan 7-halogenase [Alteromonas salexigens]
MNNPDYPDHIVIAGGGSAGWISASLISHHFRHAHTRITLIESPQIGTVGVGEGSTPHLKQLFTTLGIEESVWMAACSATYKNGIQFEQWYKEGAPGYFHPFPSAIDHATAREFLIACERRRQGYNCTTVSDEYFLASWLTRHYKSPKTNAGEQQVAINYAYHFDAGKLADFLRDVSVKQGVTHIQSTIDEVTRNQKGDLATLHLANGDTIKADFFLDCTGFSSRLLQNALEVPFVSYADSLFNDQAVAVATGPTATPLPATRSVAMTNGWRWEIPLTSRVGNGYVFASDFESPEDASDRLMAQLGRKQVNADSIRHIRIKVGRVSECWSYNCLAVGLSQGFIEPLEATALHLVQETVEQFLSAWSAGNYSPQHQLQFNQLMADRFDGIRDYIVAHYHLSSRQGPYWNTVRHEARLSDTLQALLQCWQEGGNLIQFIEQENIGHYYSPVSWYCLLSGYQLFPVLRNSESPRPPLTAIQATLTKWGARFQPHNAVLHATP